jgi:hypothetical protein
VLSLGLWFALIQPVNAEWGRVLATGTETEALESYARLRKRWEYGHVAAFLPWLVGVGCLIVSVLTDTLFEGDRHEKNPGSLQRASPALGRRRLSR